MSAHDNIHMCSSFSGKAEANLHSAFQCANSKLPVVRNMWSQSLYFIKKSYDVIARKC